MKKNVKKNSSGPPRGAKKGKNFPLSKDPFFSSESRKRRKIVDDEIESGESDEDNGFVNEGAENEEFEEETADEKRKRLANEYLEKIREIARRGKEREDEEKDDDDDDDESGDEGGKDSLVAQILQQEQLEDSGRVRREIASRVLKPEARDGFQVLIKHRQSVTAVALSDDDLKGFSSSKDGTILHWDVDCGKGEKYQWPSYEVLKSHGVKDPQGRAARHSKVTLSLAVSSDGRYLASGGLDRHVHIWDTRTREHIQAFPGHRGPVSCLTFRQGTSELFSGSFDRTVKIWNVEDRAYINTLFGHQSEVLTIDCLRKERLLTVGRDRSMQLWKVPEESRLVFRAPASSLECCCFISNDEFLTGSDDGSIELWTALKKKPVYIVRNAHPSSLCCTNLEPKENGAIPNGCMGNGNANLNTSHNLSAHSWVSSVSVCRNSDLAASGAGNGFVRLWALGSDKKDVRPLYDLPLVGFLNSLTFANSGRFVVAGVGQEPRLGRWGRIPASRNGVAVHPLKLS
ncbi:U3 snoRNP-associated protein-like YAO [Cucurbita maxima]|uniref:U3 snoRNP-associated protein-like YAO n=1 Tax=Cucurbita maxima TaxID=3661 RepID=A0A6J1K2B3_CUCMA|nr:U3 snoRNP-associated protein-like YAO [Cucurbita maxima]XP_022994785.1 U3 snoRNP-associated protein-like YAO [Cucurbita maxima]XP_022994786.1 U3 snoRNP-associated protein-like YAO [Cucurbita maxima]XP_022994787.1 U3 snoRNP-associated protein-like YAO [Cucurbita maxima]